MIQKNKSKYYISLQGATKFCSYSQEYLSLRARSGKLKAKKIGRNWVTTEEWLKEYLSKAEDYNNHLNGNGNIKKEARSSTLSEPFVKAGFARSDSFPREELGSAVKLNEPPENLPIGEIEHKKEKEKAKSKNSKLIFAMAVIVLLLITGTFFGALKTGKIEKNIAENTLNIFKDYADWIGGKTRLGLFKKEIFAFGVWIKEKITPVPSEVSLTKEELIKIEEKQTRDIIEKFQEGISELKGGISVREIIKEVKKITEVQPVKEITKETIKIDGKELENLKGQISYLEEELSKRLYAPGGVITQQIYIKEPVSSPKIYQENGDIVLQTVGSGNVILSAATGLNLSGSQVIIDSISSLSPLIYLADSTKINGDLTVTGSINGGALSVTSITASGNASIGGDASVGGKLTVAGNLIVSGDLTVVGAQNYSGAAVFTASSTSPALKVIQNGTGNIVQFMDSGADIFIIADGGYTTLATLPSVINPAFLFQTSDTSNWATGTATFFGINATSTFNGRFLDFQKDGISLFRISDDGSVTSNATITAVSFVSAANDSTVRKSGEEVLREILPISRYDIPAQTGTTSYFRISKSFEQNPLSSVPEPLPGATRVYKLIIKYDDNIPINSSSSWRVYRPAADTTSDSFILLGRNSSQVLEGIATTTPNLTIPETDWQVDVKLSEADVGKNLRIFQIFLAAFDKIN